MNQVKSFLIFGILSNLLLFSCDSKQSGGNTKSPRVKSVCKVTSPKNGSIFTIGDTINFEISKNATDIEIDSILVSPNVGKYTDTSFEWQTAAENPGKKNLLVSIFLSNGNVEKKRHQITLLSALEPTQYTYRTVNTFVHDPDAFTEGLIYKSGQLYESTGEKGFSTLRRVDLRSGKVQKSIDLTSQYFGEGIAIVDDKIFMLSWKERTGFIFDKQTLEAKGQFSYATEGWGLTAHGDTLIMSNGTHVLQFLDASGFNVIRQLEVYDKNGPVDALNELEFINGDIFAVRWQTENIYIIDASTGKVKGIVDLSGIFDYSLYNRRIDVLNGIAYNSKTETYYVTGKWWPKLFEIELIRKNNI
ncbi:MAG: glutaminyl-peptide cyclotransferase [Reichenbachiella sp.]|uniref:glutaminyl-peptide cyclotransferase n=1 Tax=Reichenbachiella sp. TaxID=2184521 RepID=UPI00326720B8